MAASKPDFVLFARGAIAILNTWPVLRLAVQEKWGGPESAAKRTWIVSTLVDAFEEKPLDQEDVEDLLLDCMVAEFETEVDDGSSQAVSRDIITAWQATLANDIDVIAKLEVEAEKHSARALPTSRAQGNGDDDWEDDDSGDEDDGEGTAPQSTEPREPKPEPVIDQDGFELVQKKGRH